MGFEFTVANIGTVGAGIALLWLAASLIRQNWAAITGARLLLALLGIAVAWSLFCFLVVYAGTWQQRLAQAFVNCLGAVAGQTWAYEATKQAGQALRGEG